MIDTVLRLVRGHHVLNERSVTVLVNLPIIDDVYQWRTIGSWKGFAESHGWTLIVKEPTWYRFQNVHHTLFIFVKPSLIEESRRPPRRLRYKDQIHWCQWLPHPSRNSTYKFVMFFVIPPITYSGTGSRYFPNEYMKERKNITVSRAIRGHTSFMSLAR